MMLSQSKHFVTPVLVSPQKCLRNKCRNSILMTQHYPDLGSASNWRKQIFNQSKNYPDLGRDSMEFLYSVLRRHFAGKPVVALQNVGCYIMNIMNASSNSNSTWLYIAISRKVVRKSASDNPKRLSSLAFKEIWKNGRFPLQWSYLMIDHHQL